MKKRAPNQAQRCDKTVKVRGVMRQCRRKATNMRGFVKMCAPHRRQADR